MILPPFFGHQTPANDGEPYRIHYSYIGQDICTYANVPKTLSKHTYIGMDVITYKIPYNPPLLIHTYLSEDILTYNDKILTKLLSLTYLGSDCLTYKLPAPSRLSGILGDKQAVLYWNAPPSSTDFPVYDYLIEYSLNNGNTWTVVNDGVSIATSAIVTGLNNNTSYSFRVAAIRSVGSAYSTPVNLQAFSDPNSLLCGFVVSGFPSNMGDFYYYDNNTNQGAYASMNGKYCELNCSGTEYYLLYDTPSEYFSPIAYKAIYPQNFNEPNWMYSQGSGWYFFDGYNYPKAYASGSSGSFPTSGWYRLINNFGSEECYSDQSQCYILGEALSLTFFGTGCSFL